MIARCRWRVRKMIPRSARSEKETIRDIHSVNVVRPAICIEVTVVYSAVIGFLDYAIHQPPENLRAS